MSKAAYILGVKISWDRSKNLVSLSKEPYIKKILELFKMQDCKLIDTSIEKGDTLSQKLCPKTSDEKEQMNKVPCLRVIGSLMYDIMCTRPDIYHVVGMTNRYQSNPTQAHWKAVKRILRSLKGTIDYSLCYQGNDMWLKDYKNVDWGGDLDVRKSI